MHPALKALLIGAPLAFLLGAIVLMVWRALYPNRNAIHGLTNKRGRIINPYIYLGVAVFILLLLAGELGLILSGRASHGTWTAMLLFNGSALVTSYLNHYRRLRRAKDHHRA